MGCRSHRDFGDVTTWLAPKSFYSRCFSLYVVRSLSFEISKQATKHRMTCRTTDSINDAVWKVKRLEAENTKRPLPEFCPPKPSLHQGVATTLKTVHENLSTPKFKESMRRTFVKVGLSPEPDGKFVVYKSHKKAGWLKTELIEMGADAASLTEAEGTDDVSRSADDQEVTLGEISSELMIEHQGDEFASCANEDDEDEDVCSDEDSDE